MWEDGILPTIQCKDLWGGWEKILNDIIYWWELNHYVCIMVCFSKVIVTRCSAGVLENEEFIQNDLIEALCQTILQIIVFNKWITLNIPKKKRCSVWFQEQIAIYVIMAFEMRRCGVQVHSPTYSKFPVPWIGLQWVLRISIIFTITVLLIFLCHFCSIKISDELDRI